MEKVKALVAAGSRLSAAVQEALYPRPIAAVAAEQGVNRSVLLSILNGQRTPTEPYIAALIAELSGTADEWRALIADEQQRRTLAVR